MAWLEPAATLLSGPFWFAGLVILGGGVLAAWLLPVPTWRVRITELSVASMVLWLALALVPMDRMGSRDPGEPASHGIAVVAPERSVDAAALGSNELPGKGLAAVQMIGGRTPARANAAGLPDQSMPAVPSSGELGAWRAPRLAAVWLLLLVVAGLRLLVGTFLLRRLLAESDVAPASVQLVAQQIAARLGMRQPAVLRIHGKLRTPFCCKLHTVVLPAQLLTDRLALRAVLAHELAHVAANDPLRRTLLALLTPMFLLHPAWWLLRRLYAQATEEAADARAAIALGRVASHYARPLIELRARLGERAVTPVHPSIVGMLGRSTSFTKRMTMLLSRDPAHAVRSLSRRQSVLANAVAMLAVALSVGAWGRAAGAQDPASQTASAVLSLERIVRPEFVACAFHDALTKVTQQTGLKIAIDTEVVSRNIIIRQLVLDAMPARQMLDTFAVAYGLRWSLQDGCVIFRVAASAGSAELEPATLQQGKTEPVLPALKGRSGHQTGQLFANPGIDREMLETLENLERVVRALHKAQVSSEQLPPDQTGDAAKPQTLGALLQDGTRMSDFQVEYVEPDVFKLRLSSERLDAWLLTLRRAVATARESAPVGNFVQVLLGTF